MGDWLVRTAWFACPDEVTALRCYVRLESVAKSIREEGARDGAGATMLRFGFASPTLVIASYTQKYGEDSRLVDVVAEGLPIENVRGKHEGWLEGNIAALEPDFAFAWSAHEPLFAALATAFPVERVGAVRVVRLPVLEASCATRIGAHDEAPRSIREALRRHPKPDDSVAIVFGVRSRRHGLIALGAWSWHEKWQASLHIGDDEQRLYARRLAGTSTANLTRDHVEELPPTRLDEETAWRLERHGPQMIWRLPEERRAMIDAAKRSSDPLEQEVGAVMERRWQSEDESEAGQRTTPEPIGPTALAELERKLAAPIEATRFSPRPHQTALRELAVHWPSTRATFGALAFAAPVPIAAMASIWLAEHGERDLVPPLQSGSLVSAYCNARIGRDPSASLESLELFRDVGARLDAASGQALRRFASRVAELAHAASRVSYWMVRDGTPGPDVPPRPTPIGPSFMREWDGDPDGVADQILFWCSAAIRASHGADPLASAAASLIALERAIAIELRVRVWWIPELGWLRLALEHALDGTTLPIAAPTPRDPDPTLLDEAVALFADGDALVDDEPAVAAEKLEAAIEIATRADAPLLAMRARHRLLGALQELDQERSERFIAEAEHIIAALPHPLLVDPYTVRGAFEAMTTSWTHNTIAWRLCQDGHYDEAVAHIERALVFTSLSEYDDNLRDTKVRILLGLGRTDEAYALVHQIEQRHPKLAAIADIVASDRYRRWRDG